jgi:ComF family protein
METVKSIGTALLDLLYPPVCLACGELGEAFCEECRGRIERVPPGWDLPAGLVDVRSVGSYEDPLRKAVLRLKFERKVALVPALGELAAAELAPALPAWKPAALVPVPIHWTRQLERGFNQSRLLCDEVSRRTGVPTREWLERTRRTPPQVGQNRKDRERSVRGAFALARAAAVEGAVVLVDDVRTSGSTLTECARVLRAVGLREVYALTVCCADFGI